MSRSKSNIFKDLEKDNVGHRIRVFAYEKYGSIDSLAKALDIHPSSLKSNYISGKSLPGAQLLYNLMQLGCDLHWLFTNRRFGQTDKDELLLENERLKNEIIALSKEKDKQERFLGKVAEQFQPYKGKEK
jgi:transcriptional regulator with XRE-family HTH domain